MSGSKTRRSTDQPVDGTVTALVRRPGGSERTAVHLDGIRAFDLAPEVVEAAGLRVGAHLTADDQGSLLEKDAPYRARERAVRLLALRDRSCQEVRLRLQQAGFGAPVAEGVISWLLELRYLDDARFAARYAAEKARGGWGQRRIAAELARKGVQRRQAEAAFAEVFTDAASGQEAAGEGVESVTALARRRFGRQLAEDPEGAARRLAGFLGRRGYDWDTIHAIVRELQAETEGPDNGPLP